MSPLFLQLIKEGSKNISSPALHHNPQRTYHVQPLPLSGQAALLAPAQARCVHMWPLRGNALVFGPFVLFFSFFVEVLVSSFSAFCSSVSGVLVVSGSRGLRPAGWASWVVSLAASRGWGIVVGDARGVDRLVAQAASAAGVPCLVVGCRAVGRLRFPLPDGCVGVLARGGRPSGSCFVLRDKFLARLASRFLASGRGAGFAGAWDGRSRGVRHTARFCRGAGVPGVFFRASGSRWVRRWAWS